MRSLPVLLLAATGLLFAQPQPKTIVYGRVGPSQIQLFVSNADGTAERPLLASDSLDYNPAWSPDGQWIVFTSERSGSADLYRVKPDGTGLQRLTTNRAYEDQADVSPDGEETFTYRPYSELTDEVLKRMGRAPVRGNTTLASIDVATREQTTIATSSGIKFFPAVLNDGEIAWVRKDGDDRGIAYRSNGKKGPLGLVRSPSWSPDGKRVTYHRLLGQNVPAWQKAWSRNPAYDLVTTNAMPAFDPSGKRLIATADNTRLVQIEPGRNVADTLFQQEEKLTQSADWSPQGDAILFGLGHYFRNRAQGAQVAMIKPDGSGLREVTSGVNNNGFPSYAPDGKRFVYRTFGPEGQGLRIMNLEDGHVTKLTEDYDNFPRWSPRGDVIMFVGRLEGSFVIFSIAPDGKRLKRLTNPGSDDSHGTWLPDGEWIAFASARTGFKDEALNTDSPQPYGEIFVMRYDGTRLEQLTDNQWEEGTPAWFPSNRTTQR